LELALACHRIVASPSAKFAFPETGLGIYPGMGGTQRTPRRIGLGLAKWLIFSGAILPAADALAIGLIDGIHPTARSAYEALRAPIPRAEGDEARPPRFAALEQLFSERDLAALLDPAFQPSGDPAVMRTLIQVRNKAPLALQAAQRLIDQSARLPLAEGLEAEFAGLHAIFQTADAKAGLLSSGRGRPAFVGR
jgi:enoyl-CoA hydratase/3-hydroxyacyl-CoA dehydrogenase